MTATATGPTTPPTRTPRISEAPRHEVQLETPDGRRPHRRLRDGGDAQQGDPRPRRRRLAAVVAVVGPCGGGPSRQVLAFGRRPSEDPVGPHAHPEWPGDQGDRPGDRCGPATDRAD